MKIRVESVSKIIGKTTIIDNTSMELESGNVYGFQGINGSGKTMLMKLISGLVYPSKGTVAVDGKILNKKNNFPESMGLLIENPAFLPSYSGFENLKMIASIKNMIDSKAIKEAMQRVGLAPEEKKKYHKYSLGMKERLGIACAVMESPELIVLDEPTNSLDDSGVEMLQRIVLEEREKGALIIISCHDYMVLTSIVDQIYKIEDGKTTKHLKKEREDEFVEVCR